MIGQFGMFVLFWIVIVVHPWDVWAEDRVTVLQDGLQLTLDTSKYVYEPTDTVGVGYTVKNCDYAGIQLSFPHSARAIFHFEKSGMVSNEIPSVVLTVTGSEFIERGENFHQGYNIPLDLLAVLAGNVITEQAFDLLDGDTLTVYGRLDTEYFGIGIKEESTFEKWLKIQPLLGKTSVDEEFDLNYDFNSDGAINFPDWIYFLSTKYLISEWRRIDAVQLSTEIYIRKKSADVNRDDRVDFGDFIFLSQAFGSRIGTDQYDIRVDLDGNGVIDFRDFVEFSVLFRQE